MLSKTTAAALALVAALVFTGCAAEPAPAEPAAEKTAAATETPTPEVAAGDVLTGEQVEELKKSGEIIAGYPVGDELIAVKWGEPIPDAVRQAVNASVNSALGSDHGTSDTSVSEDGSHLVAELKNEATKLGGISLAALRCGMSFSTVSNSFQPTWGISEPGPSGVYGSYQEAYAAAEAWQGGKQTGKRMYVVINNLGCAQ